MITIHHTDNHLLFRLEQSAYYIFTYLFGRISINLKGKRKYHFQIIYDLIPLFYRNTLFCCEWLQYPQFIYSSFRSPKVDATTSASSIRILSGWTAGITIRPSSVIWINSLFISYRQFESTSLTLFISFRMELSSTLA